MLGDVWFRSSIGRSPVALLKRHCRPLIGQKTSENSLSLSPALLLIESFRSHVPATQITHYTSVQKGSSVNMADSHIPHADMFFFENKHCKQQSHSVPPLLFLILPSSPTKPISSEMKETCCFSDQPAAFCLHIHPSTCSDFPPYCVNPPSLPSLPRAFSSAPPSV